MKKLISIVMIITVLSGLFGCSAAAPVGVPAVADEMTIIARPNDWSYKNNVIAPEIAYKLPLNYKCSYAHRDNWNRRVITNVDLLKSISWENMQEIVNETLAICKKEHSAAHVYSDPSLCYRATDGTIRVRIRVVKTTEEKDRLVSQTYLVEYALALNEKNKIVAHESILLTDNLSVVYDAK